MVGGFDGEKGIGVIYLYKLIYEKNTHPKIENISRVFYNNYKELNSINCIVQSTNTGNILISCIDGNIYSFTFRDIYELK